MLDYGKPNDRKSEQRANGTLRRLQGSTRALRATRTTRARAATPITVEDPGVFTMPWSARNNLWRRWRWPEWCAQKPRVVILRRPPRQMPTGASPIFEADEQGTEPVACCVLSIFERGFDVHACSELLPKKAVCTPRCSSLYHGARAGPRSPQRTSQFQFFSG